MRRLGFRSAFLVVATIGGLLAACGFGVDLENLFGDGRTDDADTGTIDAATDGAEDIDATIPKAQVLQIGAGDSYACGRRVDGTVMCWGRGDDGRLGNAAANDASKPVLVKDMMDATDLSVGDDHACVVRKSGEVYCWGRNTYGQVGNGSTTESRIAVPVTNLTDAAVVVAGGEFTCALKKEKTVVCWGRNAAGQIGDGTNDNRSTPVPVKDLAGVKQIALGSAHACALTDAGEVWCWGENNEGQLGNGAAPTDVNVPTKIANLTGVTAIGSGPNSGHTCAVVGATGAVQCWGLGERGALGNGKTDSVNATPQAVVGFTEAVSVTTGDRYSCALKKSGAVNCWGNNEWRTLGVGDGANPSQATTPVPVDKLTAGVQEVKAGSGFVCALHNDGANVSCWGTNNYHALGRNTRAVAETPVKINVPALGSIALGRDHSCGVDKAGALHCWGINVHRQQITSAYTVTGAPTAVTGITGTIARATGGDIHTCVLQGTEIRCWGHGQYGALGHGAMPYIQTSPVVFNAPAATDVGAGSAFTCALLSNKQVYCAGLNDDTRLGRTGGNSSTPAPVLLPPPPPVDAGDEDADAEPPPGPVPFGNVDQLSVGRFHSCAVHGGKVSCWGTNSSGQLGVTSGARAVPFEVPLNATATMVAAGEGHSCALIQGGSIRCWGRNSSGQSSGTAGSGSQIRTPDLSGKTATAIAAGDEHSCALLSDQTVACWGSNFRGQLGNGTRTDANQPVVVPNLTGVTALVAENDRTCVLAGDGELHCWGSNRFGDLGDGALMLTGVPLGVDGY